MPSDSKRVFSTVDTIDYHSYSIAKELEQMNKCYLEKVRMDGRNFEQHRPTAMRVGVISQAKGSAYVECGRTKAVCSVHEPREIPNRSDFSAIGQLYCELKWAPFSGVRRRGYLRDSDERECSVNLRRALEPAVMLHQFPNCQVDVYVMILEDDGSCLATAINCATLALADASVPMHDLVTAVTLAIPDSSHEVRFYHFCVYRVIPNLQPSNTTLWLLLESMGGHVTHELPQQAEYRKVIFVDPSMKEEALCLSKPFVDSQNQGLVTVAYMTTLQQINEIVQSGQMDVARLKTHLDSLLEENKRIYDLCRRCLVQHVVDGHSQKGDQAA